MHELQTEQTASGILFILLLLLIVAWFAKKINFFNLPPASKQVPVSFRQTAGGFLTYLIFAFFILPLAIAFFAYLKTGSAAGVNFFSKAWLGWIQLIALWMIFFLFILYIFVLKRETRHYIFWGGKERTSNRFWRGVGIGVLGWAISYPFVLAVSLLSKYVSLWIWGQAKVEQVAVKQLKMTMGSSGLFALMIFAIAVLVPFVEEFLFRGLLQNFLKRYLGRSWAIVLGALIFSFAHFSTSQGIGNFQLITTLFILSLFLGFIYEKHQTLWASIAMHTTFNSFSMAMIILGLE